MPSDDGEVARPLTAEGVKGDEAGRALQALFTHMTALENALEDVAECFVDDSGYLRDCAEALQFVHEQYWPLWREILRAS